MKTVNIVFDMDDVVSNTNKYFLQRLLKHLSGLTDPTPLESEICRHIVLHEGFSTLLFQHQTKEIYPELHDAFRQLIWDVCMKDNTYMLEVELNTPIVRYIKHDLAPRLDVLEHVKLHICTHRGFTDVGENYTRQWLEKCHLNCFENVFALDSKVHPNKLDFLDQQFGDDYILVDDNPIHTDVVLPKNDKLIIYTGINDLPQFKEQNQVKYFAAIHGIETLIDKNWRYDGKRND